MNSRLVSRADLSMGTRNAMFQLLAAQFEGVRLEIFLADLEAKNWVLLMEDEAGVVKGFTTLLHYRTTRRGQPIQVVYSGDTVVDPSAAGTSVLWRSWLGAVNQLRGDDTAPLYWLLIVSGFRTYRFMSIFWRQFIRDTTPRCHRRCANSGTRSQENSSDPATTPPPAWCDSRRPRCCARNCARFRRSVRTTPTSRSSRGPIRVTHTATNWCA